MILYEGERNRETGWQTSVCHMGRRISLSSYNLPSSPERDRSLTSQSQMEDQGSDSSFLLNLVFILPLVQPNAQSLEQAVGTWPQHRQCHWYLQGLLCILLGSQVWKTAVRKSVKQTKLRGSWKEVKNSSYWLLDCITPNLDFYTSQVSLWETTNSNIIHRNASF